MEQKLKKANPAPLGLLGFGMTTVLLNIENAGFVKLTMVILAMGIMVGGLAQIIAGILEFKNNNTFGGVAFTAYGFFWLSLVLIWTGLPGFKASDVDNVSMGMYLLLWGVFTLFMFIGTLKHKRISQLVFGSLTVLFFLLALGKFTDVIVITRIAGFVGILCGLFAMYDAVGQIVNEEYDKVVLPL